MEKKILVYAAVGIIVVITVVIAILPSSSIIKSLVPTGSEVPTSLTAVTTQIKPISIQDNGTAVTAISKREATITTNFYISNPNTTTVILEFINYEISADGLVIGHGQVGQRYEGSIQSSYYYPLIEKSSSNVQGQAIIKNTGNTPDLWAALENGTAKLRVSGTVHYATKTAFNGQDYTTDFNFTK